MLCHVSDPNLGLIVFILNEQLTQDIHETSTVSRSYDVVIIVQDRHIEATRTTESMLQ